MSNLELALDLLPLETLNTIYMVFVSGIFAVLIGLPIGVILMVTGPRGIKPILKLHKFLGILVNIGRSFPFAILIVALIPLTRLIVGTSLGTTASIVPLAIAAIPFIARLVETSLNEVDSNIIEALTVMGTPVLRLIWALLHEALPTLISQVTLMLINLVGYSAMAGLVGGGGLGEVAIQYGYHRFNTFMMSITVVDLILLVAIIQWCGNRWVQYLEKKRGKLHA